MSNITLHGHEILGGLKDRSVGRSLAHIDNQTTVELAKIEQVAELQVARLHGLTFVGSQAMHGVAMVSQLEGQLAQLIPLATTRLQGVADVYAFCVAQVVVDTLHRMSGRC
jgi:hypothetical protein